MLGGRGLGHAVPRLEKVFGLGYVIGTLEGARLKVSMNDPYWITPLLRCGTYEPEVGSALRSVLGPDSAFIDCGANIGYWSVLGAELIGVEGRVLAVEASPTTAAWLRENARLNGDSFRVVEAAVWGTSGDILEIAVDAARHSWASVDPRITPALKGAGFTSTLVETITIDDAVRQVSTTAPDLIAIKIDVEGSEEQAIQGATRTLERDVLLIYEEHGRSREAEVTDLLLSERGMHIFDVSSPGAPRRILKAAQLEKVMSDESRGYNFCAAHPGTKAYRRLTSMFPTRRVRRR